MSFARTCFFLLLLGLLPVHANQLGQEGAEAFLRAVIQHQEHPELLRPFLDDSDSRIANRLGIRYQEAPLKELIASLPEGRELDSLRLCHIPDVYSIEDLDQPFSRLHLFPESSSLHRSWIFSGQRVVSTVLYESRDWQRLESRTFIFLLSDPSLFHEANIELLEEAVDRIAGTLEIEERERALLEREKIYYIYCRDQEEVHRLCGYDARGMYILSHDLLLSSFSSHVHELAHLLINFRLKNAHLYTHPTLLEGYAVSQGGRGGEAGDIQLQLGLFLHKLGAVEPQELLSAQAYHQFNASISYPAAGLWNTFLLESLGAESYLQLYHASGGGPEQFRSGNIEPAELPESDQWERFLENPGIKRKLLPGWGSTDPPDSIACFVPLADCLHLGFALPGNVLLGTVGTRSDYNSTLFRKHLPEHDYQGERYFMRVSAEEVALYDLATNTMRALYASSLSLEAEALPQVNGNLLFRVHRTCLPAFAAQCRMRLLTENP